MRVSSLQRPLNVAPQIHLGVLALHLPEDPPILPDKEGNRDAGDITVVPDCPFVRDNDRKGEAEFLDHRRSDVVDGYGDYRETLATVGQKYPLKSGQLIPAGRAPACPEIQEHDLALKIRKPHHAAAQVRKTKSM